MLHHASIVGLFQGERKGRERRDLVEGLWWWDSKEPESHNTAVKRRTSKSKLWNCKWHGWWFQRFLKFTPTCGNDPNWLIFFRWVETWNHQLVTVNIDLSVFSRLGTSGKNPGLVPVYSSSPWQMLYRGIYGNPQHIPKHIYFSESSIWLLVVSDASWLVWFNSYGKSWTFVGSVFFVAWSHLLGEKRAVLIGRKMSGSWNPKKSFHHLSGQFIRTSAEVTPNGGLEKENPPQNDLII